MRRLLFLDHRLVLPALVLTLVAGGCSNSQPPQQSLAPATAASAVMKTVRIPIEGMSCASCVASIKSALSKLDGVAKVDVDLAERVARVQFIPTKVAVDSIVATINELGFRAGPAADVN